MTSEETPQTPHWEAVECGRVYRTSLMMPSFGTKCLTINIPRNRPMAVWQKSLTGNKCVIQEEKQAIQNEFKALSTRINSNNKHWPSIWEQTTSCGRITSKIYLSRGRRSISSRPDMTSRLRTSAMVVAAVSAILGQWIISQ